MLSSTVSISPRSAWAERGRGPAFPALPAGLAGLIGRCEERDLIGVISGTTIIAKACSAGMSRHGRIVSFVSPVAERRGTAAGCADPPSPPARAPGDTGDTKFNPCDIAAIRLSNRLLETPRRQAEHSMQGQQSNSVGNPVIALHCSGAGAGQWRALGDALGARHQLFAPEHYGSEAAGSWCGKRAFTLADEAARTIAWIDRCDMKVHLVGHSYGGGVALHVALARQDRIASLTLYEPSAFHLLKQLDVPAAASAFAEIAALAQETAYCVGIGDLRRAASTFVDYWSGSGAWLALRPAVQAALMRWVPKASLDFYALMQEPTPLGAYASLVVPVLILRGELAPPPSRLIAETLSARLSRSRSRIVEGAGHMGPLTRAAFVGSLIADHVAAAEAAAGSELEGRTRRSGRRGTFVTPSLAGAVL